MAPDMNRLTDQRRFELSWLRSCDRCGVTVDLYDEGVVAVLDIPGKHGGGSVFCPVCADEFVMDE